MPDTITLLPLSTTSPALESVELVWLYLGKRCLSHRMLDENEVVLEAVCRAWNRPLDETDRLTSLTAYPYLTVSEILSFGMSAIHGQDKGCRQYVCPGCN